MGTLPKNNSSILKVLVFYIPALILLASEHELLATPNSATVHCRNNAEMFRNTNKEHWNAEECEELHNIYYLPRKSPQATFNSTSIRIAAVLIRHNYAHGVNYTIENGKFHFTGGYIYESFKYIAESYNLGIIALNGNKYAAASDDSNTTDIGTMLINGECDVSISVHEYNIVRLAKFSYLHPHINTGLTAYFVQPPAGSIRNIYYYVFTLDSWAAVFLTWVIAVSALWGITFIKKLTYALQHNENQSFMDILLWALAVVCQNGVTIRPESLSLKIALLCSLLTGLFIYLVYSAAIVSILAWDVPIKNVSDMISLGFNIHAPINSISPKLAYYMQALKDEAPQLTNEGKIVRMDPFPAFEKMMTEGKTAYLTMDLMYLLKSTDAYSGKYNCKVLSRLIIDGAPITQAMIVKKGSRWREFLNIKLLWEMNNGILHRIMKTHRKVINYRCSWDPPSQHQIKSLGWTDIFSAVIILLILYAVSLLCFSAEKLFAPIVQSVTAASIHKEDII